MAHPLSVRFRRAEVLERLKAEAASRRLSSSALAEELIEEGLRSRRHPMVAFRDGSAGRRAALAGGPDIWEVVGAITGGDLPVERRVDWAMECLGLSRERVIAAMDYYAAFAQEIDCEIASNDAAALEAEEAWGRRRLLAG